MLEVLDEIVVFPAEIWTDFDDIFLYQSGYGNDDCVDFFIATSFMTLVSCNI